MLATAEIIGTGLDCTEVYSVICIGFPESVIDMVEDIGRCGKGRNNSDGVVTDEFSMILSLSGFDISMRDYIPLLDQDATY